MLKKNDSELNTVFEFTRGTINLKKVLVYKILISVIENKNQFSFIKKKKKKRKNHEKLYF